MLAYSHGRRVEAEVQPITCAIEGGPCSVCKERATIAQKIKQLEKEMEEEIAKLKAKYHALGSAMNAIHDPFIHKLPPEISSHVFCLSLPKLEDDENARRLLDRPLRLGAVCRKWRQLTWATPELWDTVYIPIGPSMTRAVAESLPGLLREWLHRSRVLPLSIFFHHFGFGRTDSHNHDSDDDSDNEYTSDDPMIETLQVATGIVIEILTSHSSRWRNLYLEVGADILGRVSGRWQPNQLFGLDIAVTGRKKSTQKFIIESKPKHLTLRYLPLPLIDIGWDNITHATLAELTINDCIEFLRRAPRLERCLLSIVRPGVSIEYVTPVLHPQLRSLHLLMSRSTDFELLEVVNLPFLEEWTQNMYKIPLPMTKMLSLIERSRCYLKVLNLYGLPSPSNDLNTLLQAIPLLERLRLTFRSASDGCTVMDGILTRIFCAGLGGGKISAEDTTPEPLLPHLQFIECILEFGGALFSWDRIPQLYRQGNKRSLVLESTASEGQIQDETALQLLQLVDEGVDLRIRDWTEGIWESGDFLKNFRNRIREQSF